jgi:hypothetical protein
MRVKTTSTYNRKCTLIPLPTWRSHNEKYHTMFCATTKRAKGQKKYTKPCKREHCGRKHGLGDWRELETNTGFAPYEGGGGALIKAWRKKDLEGPDFRHVQEYRRAARRKNKEWRQKIRTCMITGIDGKKATGSQYLVGVTTRYALSRDWL